MSSSFVFDRIETRGAQENGRKRYLIKGYASAKNAPDLYKWHKKGSTYKSFKDLFTTECINDMKEQLKRKPIFVDKQHETAKKYNVKKILNDMSLAAKKNGIDFSQHVLDANSYLDSYDELPLIKLNSFDVDDHGLLTEVELNPYYREYDDEHAKVFDSTWKSLEDKFINSMSLNFKVIDADYTDNGDENFAMIKKVDVYGISLMNNSSVQGTDIVEVAIRGAMEVHPIEIRGAEEAKRMETEQIDRIVEEKLKVEVQKIKAEAEQKARLDDDARRQKEAVEEKEKWKIAEAEYKKQIAELEAKTGPSKRQTPVYNTGQGPASSQDGMPAMTETDKKLIDALHHAFPEPKHDYKKMDGWQKYAAGHNPSTRQYDFEDYAKLAHVQAMLGGNKNPYASKNSEDIVVRRPNETVERYT